MKSSTSLTRRAFVTVRGKNCLPCGGKFTLPSTFSEWTTLFENTAMVAAMVDRLTFQSYILDMNGQSYRLEQTKKQRR